MVATHNSFPFFLRAFGHTDVTERWRRTVHSEEGHALPSALILIVLLFSLSATLLIKAYVEHALSLQTIDAVKAVYAAKNGIVSVTTQFEPSVFLNKSRVVTFDDDSHVEVDATAWGGFVLLRSKGVCCTPVVFE